MTYFAYLLYLVLYSICCLFVDISKVQSVWAKRCTLHSLDRHTLAFREELCSTDPSQENVPQ